MTTFVHRRSLRTTCVFALSIAASLSRVCFASAVATAASEDSVPAIPAITEAGGCAKEHNSRDAGTLHILLGHSIVWHARNAITRIFIGNPSVLQSFATGRNETVLTAKSAGLSSFLVWDAAGLSCTYNVEADLEPDKLQKAIVDAYPASHIEVTASEGRIYLNGDVPTQTISDGAAKLASAYAKDVINSLRVVPVRPTQVQLKLRIVEVDRNRLEQYGVNFAGGGKTPFTSSTQQYSAPVPVSGVLQYTDPLNLLLFSSRFNIGATVKDLEQKQILQVLAEPTLTAISGEPAKFLSGGEFPYPVVQGTSSAPGAAAITVAFRPYGVKVDFTPTVNDNGIIRLKVAPEVSTLDFSNAVTISGFTIPALSTRRAETEIELRSGQSFAMSGLLDHRTIENLSSMPGLSGIPIVGKLFTSRSYTHSVVELVVLVTATVVDPLTVSAPAEPVFAVPNMTSDSFDKEISKQQKSTHSRK